MSYSVSNIDYAALPAALLPLAKQHMRVTFDDDDETITEYLQWAISYAEQFTGLAINWASAEWQPAATTSRTQCPLQPVGSFSVSSGGADVSDDYRLESAALTAPVWLVRIDGTAIAADAIVTLAIGYDDPASIPPALKGNILRIAATIYENRESITTLSLETVPFWLNDMLGGLWVPRA